MEFSIIDLYLFSESVILELLLFRLISAAAEFERSWKYSKLFSSFSRGADTAIAPSAPPFVSRGKIIIESFLKRETAFVIVFCGLSGKQDLKKYFKPSSPMKKIGFTILT